MTQLRTQKRSPRVPISKLKLIFGNDDDRFMSLRSRTKKRKRKWKACKNEAQLKKGNIALLQGNGVHSIDIDGAENVNPDELVQEFLRLNPSFNYTFTTAADRGCNFHFADTNTNLRSCNLYLKDDTKIGEFRSKGNYTVIQGIHPEGNPYRVITELPILPMPLNQIKWFDGTSLEDHIKLSCKKGTQDCTETLVVRLTPLCEHLQRVEDTTSTYLPTAPHQTDDLHWRLSGELLAMGLRFDHSDCLQIGRRWYDLANKRFLNGQSREAYAVEFAHRFKWRRFPKGTGDAAFEAALERARQLDAPEIVSDAFPHSKPIQLIGSLCRELARETNNKTFFLSHRSIQGILEAGSHKIGGEIIKSLESVDAIICVNRFSKKSRKAKVYRYLLDDINTEAEA
jgi:hypothetical protein